MVHWPSVIDGRIDRPGDDDLFAIECGKGDDLVFEVLARRLHSPLDARIEVLDADGRVLASNDDSANTETPFLTQHADPKLAFTAEADGIHYLRIADTQGKAGPDHAYVLHLRPPQPGFAARVVPSALSGPAGSSVPLTLHVLRKEGFDGEVEIELDGEYHGASLSGAVVPAGCDSIRATLDLPASVPLEPIRLRMVAKASETEGVNPQTVEPCDDMLQAFFYGHLVPAKLPPGTRGNLVMSTSFKRTNNKGKKFHSSTGCLPAIPFMVGTAIDKLSSL